MPPKVDTIDAYLDEIAEPKRTALSKLRASIHQIVPQLEECISYGMPAFRYKGKVIAGFAATSTGCSYYPFSGITLTTLAADLGAYKCTKSALHFDPAQALPTALLRALIQARIAEL